MILVVWRFRGPVYDVKGGTVAPSSSSRLTGVEIK
ncbi:colicin release lysis protein [Escherichia coli]